MNCGSQGGKGRCDPDLCHLFVESLDEYAVFFLDRSRRVLSWNRGAEILLGYSHEEMSGRSADVIFTPQDLKEGAPEKESDGALANGKAMDDRWHVRKDGTRFWAAGVMVRLVDSQGEFRGFAKILRDQTALRLARDERSDAERALQASERRFRRLIEANIVGVGIRDDLGTWLEANDELLRILGRRREELRSRHIRWEEATPEEYRAADERGAAEANERGACTPYEKEYVRPNGERVPVLTGYATVSGVQGHYVCFVLDLGPQKQVERALREADQRKDEFLAMLAHELRNPLAPISAGLEILDLGRSDAETLKRIREMMERQVGAMVRLVDDLLDVSRIMRGKVELRIQRTDLQSIVARAVETSKPSLEARNHEFSVSVPEDSIPIDGDPVRLAQVVTNLLNNAAKFTEAGGKIQLTTTVEGGTAVISVRDNGVGIAPKWLSQVFDLFTQADPTLARSQGGLGIGLTLVRRLVEMHGGSVEAKSDGIDKGSEFIIRLPIAQTAEKNEETPPEPPRADHPLEILIIDDNVDAAEALGILVETLGHHSRIVNTAEKGLQEVMSKPDVVLLDIGLPEMDGYEVVREIRNRFPLDGPVVAAVSGYGGENDRRRSKEAGFDHHLVKPVGVRQLQNLLAAAANGSR